MTEVYYPDLSHPAVRDARVRGRRPSAMTDATRARRTVERLTPPTARRSTHEALAAHEDLHHRSGARDGAGRRALRVARPASRYGGYARARPAAHQRRHRRRRLDARARAARRTTADGDARSSPRPRSRASRLGLRRGPTSDDGLLDARLRRAAARQRRPAGRTTAPDRARGAPRPHAGARLRRRRPPAREAATRRWTPASTPSPRSYTAGLARLPRQLKPMPGRAAARRAASTRRRCWCSRPPEDKATRARSSPRRPCRGAGASCDRHDNPRSAPYHLVWARDLYQIATALLAAGRHGRRQPRARLPLRRQQRPTARSRRTPRSTARRSGRRCRWTSGAADRARLAARARPAPRDWAHVRRRRRLHRREGARSPSRSAGRTRRATRRGRSRRRSPAWSARPTSRARNGDATRGRATSDGRRLAAPTSQRWTATAQRAVLARPVLPAR